VILTSLEVDPEELRRRSGWEIKPEGACRGDVCVPLPRGGAAPAGGGIDARVLSERLGMPLLEEEGHGLWCLGPQSGGRALSSALLPEIVLPDREGQEFDLRSLRGQKIFLLAWASW
jgi:hypothetical protein